MDKFLWSFFSTHWVKSSLFFLYVTSLNRNVQMGSSWRNLESKIALQGWAVECHAVSMCFSGSITSASPACSPPNLEEPRGLEREELASYFPRTFKAWTTQGESLGTQHLIFTWWLWTWVMIPLAFQSLQAFRACRFTSCALCCLEKGRMGRARSAGRSILVSLSCIFSSGSGF